MPLYLDVHNLDGPVSAKDVEEAHRKDLELQGKHGVKYQRYWVDEKQGKIFCLVEAPNKDAANIVHKHSHGMVADEIYEVKEGA